MKFWTEGDPSGTTGDPSGTGGEGGEQSPKPSDGSGDPPVGGSGDPEKSEREKQLEADLEKSKAEAAESERKNQQLLSEKGRYERTQADVAEAQQAEASTRYQAYMQKLYADAEAGDYHASVTLASLRQGQEALKWQQKELQKIRNDIKIEKIPDEHKAAVEQLVELGYDPTVAEDIILGREAREGKLPGKKGRPKPPDPPPGGDKDDVTVRSTTRSVSDAEHKEREMTRAQISEQVEAALERGDKQAVRKLRQDLADGTKVEV